MTKWIRQRVLSGERLAGAWLNMHNPISAELAGLAGYDWALIDMEHGLADQHELMEMLMGVAPFKTAPLVRIAGDDPKLYKLALDLGASGIMTPWVNDAEQAARVVDAMRYSPQGKRGVANSVRASDYGASFETYFAEANENLLNVVQIETTEALKNVESIAVVDGVDVLFVGPLDLTVSLGVRGQLDHADFQAAVKKVVAAAKGAKKAAGILLPDTGRLKWAVESGFTFIAVGSDKRFIQTGMKGVMDAFTGL